MCGHKPTLSCCILLLSWEPQYCISTLWQQTRSGQNFTFFSVNLSISCNLRASRQMGHKALGVFLGYTLTGRFVGCQPHLRFWKGSCEGGGRGSPGAGGCLFCSRNRPRSDFHIFFSPRHFSFVNQRNCSFVGLELTS